MIRNIVLLGAVVALTACAEEEYRAANFETQQAEAVSDMDAELRALVGDLVRCDEAATREAFERADASFHRHWAAFHRVHGDFVHEGDWTDHGEDAACHDTDGTDAFVHDGPTDAPAGCGDHDTDAFHGWGDAARDWPVDRVLDRRRHLRDHHRLLHRMRAYHADRHH